MKPLFSVKLRRWFLMLVNMLFNQSPKKQEARLGKTINMSKVIQWQSALCLDSKEGPPEEYHVYMYTNFVYPKNIGSTFTHFKQGQINQTTMTSLEVPYNVRQTWSELRLYCHMEHLSCYTVINSPKHNTHCQVD